MALVGFSKMTVRVLDSKAPAVDENVFSFEGKERKGATQTVDIKGLAADTVKAYGSNLAYYIARKGTGDVTADFGILDLPWAVRQVLLGYEKDGELTFVGEKTEAPYCSVLLESEDLSGEGVYIGFFKGAFSADELSAETKKEKTEEPGADKLAFSALAQADGDNKGRYVAYYIGNDEQEITKLKQALSIVS